MDPLAALAPLKRLVEERLAARLSTHRDDDGASPPPALVDAMGYSLLAGGKRLRPILVLLAARAAARGAFADDAIEAAVPAALAVEYVHTYSLVHDDLPALDDDALRRGRPTLHVAKGEALALLAGDALLTDAFAIVASARARAAEQVRELALAAGSAGMVGGQLDDVQGEGRALDEHELASIHGRKTGRLFAACCALGGLAVDADAHAIERLRAYARRFGLAFQIADDVLDVDGDVASGGKGSGRDAKRDKATYVRLLGLDAAKARARDEGEAAAALAESFGDAGAPLAALARFAATRRF